MMNKRMVQILALVVVLSMIFTTAVFAAPGQKGYEKNNKKVELKDDDYNHALLSLIEKEIVKGYGKGDYGLSGNVKRGDVIVMIIRALALEDKYNVKELSENYLKLMTDIEDFDDVKDKEAYYYGPIKIAKKLGIAKGDGRYFKPNKPVTIQEVIWLIERTEDLLDDDLDLNSERIKELTEIYEGDLNDFAKRRDVFWMLNYVLEGIEEDNIKKAKLTDINLNMDDDSELDFIDSWFIDAFKAVKKANGKDLEYVKFELPIKDSKLYTLYYDYDKDVEKNTLVNEVTNYYLESEADDNDKEIKNITLVPKNTFDGTITIKYTAFDEKHNPYIGLMKVTVNGLEEVQKINTITVTMDEDNKTNIDFIFELDEEISSNLMDKLEYVKFNSVDRGKLFIDYAGHDDLGVILNNKYYFVHIDDNLVFEYAGNNTANIKFTVYDEDDKPYEGLIQIVQDNEIKIIETIKLTMDVDDVENIDFLGELKEKVDLIDKGLYDKLDNVKFTSINRGTLNISYADNAEAKVDLNEIYYLDHIDEDLTFNYKGSLTVNIKYTVYDIDAGKSYDGLIEITQ